MLDNLLLEPDGLLFELDDLLFEPDDLLFELDDLLFEPDDLLFEPDDLIFEPDDFFFGFEYCFLVSGNPCLEPDGCLIESGRRFFGPVLVSADRLERGEPSRDRSPRMILPRDSNVFQS